MINSLLKRIAFSLPEPLPSLIYRFRRMLKYGLVGITNSFVDFVFYKFFIAFFLQTQGLTSLISRFDLTIPTVAKIISTEIAIIWSFTLNSKYTFKDKTNSRFSLTKRFLFFQLTLLGSLVIGASMIQVLTKTYGIEHNTYYFLATIPVSYIWNYTLNYLITWRQRG